MEWKGWFELMGPGDRYCFSCTPYWDETETTLVEK